MFNIEYIGYIATAIGIGILVCNIINKKTIVEITPENFKIYLAGFLSTVLWTIYHFLKYGMSLTFSVTFLELLYGAFVLNLFLISKSKEDAPK